MASESPSSTRRWRGVAIAATCTAAMIVNSSNNTSVAIALPSIGSSLHARSNVLQWFVSAYPLSSGCLLLVSGHLADNHGRKRVLVAGSAVLAAFTLGCGFATNGVTLAILRALQGIGGAATIPAAIGILAHEFPPSQPRARAAAFSSFSAGAPIGGALGMILGGLVTQLSKHTWRAQFWLSAALAFATLLAAILVIPADAPSNYQSSSPPTPSPNPTSASQPKLGPITPDSEELPTTTVPTTYPPHSPAPAKTSRAATDWPGLFLSTAGLVLLVFVLGQGSGSGVAPPRQERTTMMTPVLSTRGGMSPSFIPTTHKHKRHPDDDEEPVFLDAFELQENLDVDSSAPPPHHHGAHRDFPPPPPPPQWLTPFHRDGAPPPRVLANIRPQDPVNFRDVADAIPTELNWDMDMDLDDEDDEAPFPHRPSHDHRPPPPPHHRHPAGFEHDHGPPPHFHHGHPPPPPPGGFISWLFGRPPPPPPHPHPHRNRKGLWHRPQHPHRPPGPRRPNDSGYGPGGGPPFGGMMPYPGNGDYMQGWGMPYIISLLVVSILLLVAFALWELHLESVHSRPGGLYHVGPARHETRSSVSSSIVRAPTLTACKFTNARKGISARLLPRAVVDSKLVQAACHYTPPPLLRPSLFSRAKGRVGAVYVVAFFQFAGFMIWAYWVQLYYQVYIGYSPVRTVVRLVPMFVTGILCNIVVALIVGKVSTGWLLATGTLCTTIAPLLFALIIPSAPYWAFGFPAAIFSVIGADFLFAAGTLFVSNAVGPDEQSLAGGVFQTMTQLGTSLGVTVSTIVLDNVTLHVLRNGDTLKAYQAANWTGVAFGVVATTCALAAFRGVGVGGKNVMDAPPVMDSDHHDTAPPLPTTTTTKDRSGPGPEKTSASDAAGAGGSSAV